MPVLPFLLLLQADVRLDVRASLEAPRVTYAELGAWVQKASGAAVYVVPAIRERKATVLVRDLPLRETMDRVAEGLFLEWERTKDGYTLRLQPEAARDEARYAKAEAAAWWQGLQDKLATLADLGRSSPDALKSKMAAALESAREYSKDSSSEGKTRAAAAWARYSELSSVVYNPMSHAAGMLLASLTPARREAILAGSPVYASNRPAPGLMQAPDGMGEAGENFQWPADARMIFGIEYRAETNDLRMTSLKAESNGWSSSATIFGGDASPSYNKALAEEPLRKRLTDWVSVRDAKILATRLTPEGPAVEPARQTVYRSLAEVLIPLHRRTGLPIVADGYRPAVVAKHMPEGVDVTAWLKDLDPAGNHGWRGYRPNVRASNGWLMLRQPRYWKQIAREVPEGRIRALEAAARRPSGATLEEFASFAAGLTPAQEPYVSGPDLVMDAPYLALEGNVPFLRLWNALPSVLRRTAQSPSGLATSAMSSGQRSLYLNCVSGRLSLSGASERMLPYLLPGGPPLPNDLRLYVEMAAVSAQEYADMVLGESYSYNPNENQVDGARASLRSAGGESFAFYGIPLRPAPPAQIRKATISSGG